MALIFPILIHSDQAFLKFVVVFRNIISHFFNVSFLISFYRVYFYRIPPVTSGTVADCSQAKDLIKDTGAKYLLADRGYDTNAIIEEAQTAGMEVIIPPKRNRKVLRDYDKNIYKLRHIVENAFLKLKQWRGIATRYVKNLQSMIAAIQIRCIALCINYL